MNRRVNEMEMRRRNSIKMLAELARGWSSATKACVDKTEKAPVSLCRLGRMVSFTIAACGILSSMGVIQTGAVMMGMAMTPATALAAGGQCRWEGGPGAAGGFSDCKVEDCIGKGGTAL